jgi:REP element-mobilizing transposase RayT
MPSNTRLISSFEVTHGKLPHWEGVGAAYFVCFALRKPAVVDLTSPEIGPVVVEALRHQDGARYLLFDYVVMPDHLHMILRPATADGTSERVTTILHDLKHWLAHALNRQVGRRGPLWQVESYDHLLRNYDDYLEKARYIYENPHRAGLVDDPARWPWWGQGSGVQG